MRKAAFVVAACMPCFTVATAWALEVGDKAPAMAIAEWVQGDPIDLKKDIGKKVYMVEFWATWCPPCKISVPILTKYQDKFKKDLTIIGVTAADDRGNSPAAVKKFVKEKGAEMNYHVAMDKGEATTKAYLGSEVVGIPYAFLVGKDGHIAWHGSPLDPALDELLPKIVNGSYDVSVAKKAASMEAEINKRFKELEGPAQRGQWSVVWDGLVGITKLDPGNIEAMDVLTQIYVNETKDNEAYRTWVKAHIEAHRGDAKVMQKLATILCANDDFARKTPELAIAAAKAAYEASGKKDAGAISTYALTCYQIGALDRAIALQQEVIAAAGGEESKQAKEVLDFYAQCKKLQEAAP